MKKKPINKNNIVDISHITNLEEWITKAIPPETLIVPIQWLRRNKKGFQLVHRFAGLPVLINQHDTQRLENYISDLRNKKKLAYGRVKIKLQNWGSRFAIYDLVECIYP